MAEEQKKTPFITSSGVRGWLALAAVAAVGYFGWRWWQSRKAREEAAGGPEEAGAKKAGALPGVTAAPLVRTLTPGSEVQQKYAGTLSSPIVIPTIGPYMVAAGKNYATPSFMMTQRKKGYTYAPVIGTKTAAGVGSVRQFFAPVMGTFTGFMLSEGGKLWAEIKTV
jgi:hypothetical protein